MQCRSASEPSIFFRRGPLGNLFELRRKEIQVQKISTVTFFCLSFFRFLLSRSCFCEKSITADAVFAAGWTDKQERTLIREENEPIIPSQRPTAVQSARVARLRLYGNSSPITFLCSHPVTKRSVKPDMAALMLTRVHMCERSSSNVHNW
jgi:hypothetical protein